MKYAYGYRYKRNGRGAAFSPGDLPGIAALYEPDDKTTLNSKLAPEFNGSGSSLAVGIYKDTTATWCHGFMFYFDTLSAQILSGQWRTSIDDRAWVVSCNGTNLRLLYSTDGTGAGITSITHPTALSAKTWYYCEIKFDSGNSEFAIRLNGGAWSTNVYNDDMFNSGSNLRLGRESGSTISNFDGRLDALYFSDDLTVLDLDMYNSGNFTDYGSLSATNQAKFEHWFTFNEPSAPYADVVSGATLVSTAGMSVNTSPLGETVQNAGDSIHTELDKSGNNNHATQSTIVSQFTWDGSKSLVGNGSKRTLNLDTLQAALATDTAGYFGGWYLCAETIPTSTKGLICFGDTNANEFLYLVHSSGTGTITAICRVAGVTKWQLDIDVNPLTINIWSHIFVVQNGTEPTIYINGVAPAQTFAISTNKTAWFSILTNVDNGRMGSLNFNGGGDLFFADGSFGQWVAGSANLTPSQALDLYNDKKSVYV